MTLNKYKKKRDFSKTSEPSGRKGEGKKWKKVQKGILKAPLFVIQKHDASHLHYDFRLEMQGVLKSWAIPKNPKIKKGQRRLAIETEDHPLSYAGFEGRIEKGQYGAGKVEIWDKGRYELIERKKDKIIVELKGKKLKGKYVLIKANFSGKKKDENNNEGKKKGKGKDKKDKNWIFLRMKK